MCGCIVRALYFSVSVFHLGTLSLHLDTHDMNLLSTWIVGMGTGNEGIASWWCVVRLGMIPELQQHSLTETDLHFPGDARLMRKLVLCVLWWLAA